mgnify:CR=1 FL=1
MSSDIFEKAELMTDCEYKRTEMCTNTDAKVNRLLNGIQHQYSDKESLKEMLDETIKLLRQEEKENDLLKVRCREYIKVIESKHNKIKELESEIKKRDQMMTKEFFRNYI